MINLKVVGLVCWLISGLLNLVIYIGKGKCSWFVFWLAYLTLILSLVRDLFV